MNTHIMDDGMENATSGRWQLPWIGWEEVLLEDCTSFSLGDDGNGGLPTAETHVKVECLGVGCFAGDDSNVSIAASSSGFDDCFDVTADVGFPGDLIEDCPLMDGYNPFELSDYFDASEPLLDCDTGFLNFLEKNADHVSVEDLSLLPHVETSLFLDSTVKSVADGSGCLTTTTVYEPCEISLDSPLEFDSVEELVVSCFENVIDCDVTSPEHATDRASLDSDYEIDADDSNDDDDEEDDCDWEWTKTSKRRKRKKLCIGSSERGKKFSRLDPHVRKKEQNKNAATKYREKKKVEEMERLALCDFLETRNRELRKEIEDKENEVKLLKELLVNVLRPAARD